MKYIHIRVKTQQTFVFKTNVLICFFSQRRPHGDISHLNKLPFQLYKTSQHITKEYQYNHHFLDEKKNELRVFSKNRSRSTSSHVRSQLCTRPRIALIGQIMKKFLRNSKPIGPKVQNCLAQFSSVSYQNKYFNNYLVSVIVHFDSSFLCI